MVPPVLALWATLIFIFWLVRRDILTRPKVSWAVWIPQIWLFIRGSRPLSYWVGGGGGGSADTASYAEGSPVDRLFALALMVAALVVVQRRRLGWGTLIANNKALFAIFLYFGFTTVWSDYTLVSFKRWTKEIGDIFILLILLTEENPLLAIRTVAVRCAYVSFPLSIPLYKYYPATGRNYGPGGGLQVTGVTGQKNDLGEICAAFGAVLLWEFLELWDRRKEEGVGKELWLRAGVFGLALWLLVACDSQTSFACLIVGSFVLLSDRIPVVKKAPLLVVLLCLVVVPVVLAGLMTQSMSQNFSTSLVQSVGRDMTFTGRTQIWELVLSLQHSPWLGMGFYSFWMGSTGEAVWDSLAAITTAHSGYVETYLDGGYVGEALLLGAMAVTGVKLARGYLRGTMFGRVGLMFWIMAVLENFSETSFFRLTPFWLMFLVVSLDVPRQGAGASVAAAAGAEEVPAADPAALA